MLSLSLKRGGGPVTLLCLGAHSDDIEIGAGGALLRWAATLGTDLVVHWRVFAVAEERRKGEAIASAADFLANASETSTVKTYDFADGYLPRDWAEAKARMEAVKAEVTPDIILTHWGGDAHQDHRIISELTWNTFRDHVILEYEIPKWDGDMGRPNAYAALSEDQLSQKIALLERHFGSQRSKGWFNADTFRGLARLRGIECRAPEGFAEAFYVRKFAVEL